MDRRWRPAVSSFQRGVSSSFLGDVLGEVWARGHAPAHEPMDDGEVGLEPDPNVLWSTLRQSPEIEGACCFASAFHPYTSQPYYLYMSRWNETVANNPTPAAG